MTFYFIQGGPLLYTILAVSVAAGTLAALEWLQIRSAQSRNAKPLEELSRLLEKRDWFGALRLLENHRHPFFKVWRPGLVLLVSNGSHSLRDLEEITQIEGQQLISDLERFLKPIGALTTVLPMLGFLGTILGLIQSFRTWETLGAQVSIGALAGGMYQAMITTAAGLLTAIPYLLLYHFFAGRLQSIALQLSKDTSQFLRALKPNLTETASETGRETLSPVS